MNGSSLNEQEALTLVTLAKTKTAMFRNRGKKTSHHLLVGPQPEDFTCLSISSLSNLEPGTESVKTDHPIKSSPIQ